MSPFNVLYFIQGHRSVLIGAFVFWTLIAPVPVWAQSGVDTRLDRLERDIDTLSRSVFKGERPAAALSAGATSRAAQDQLEARLTQLEQDLRDLTAKVEEQGNRNNQSQRALDDIVGRLSAVEQRVGAAVPAPAGSQVPATSLPMRAGPNDPADAASSPTVQPLGAVPADAAAAARAALATPVEDPNLWYENALALLKQRDYGLAEKSLTDFLAAHGTHTLAPNAKYWLGETYFAQNRFDQAARIFAEGYQKFPKGPKAADNLLKLGLSLSSMDKKDDACVALKQIAKDFPNGAQAVRARANAEIQKLACG